MKKHLFLLMALCTGFLSGCEEEKGQCDNCLTPPDQTQMTQVACADEETTGAGFTFQSANVWHATVKEVASPLAQQPRNISRAGESAGNNVVWLKLLNNGKEAYTGGAGTTNLTIEMDQNYTGEDRKATIVVESGSGSFTVSVEQKAEKVDGTANEAPVKVTEIRLDKEALTLEAGEKAKLSATVLPEEATIKSVTWSCPDSTVAMVHPVTGEITALGTGTTFIIATSSSNKSVTASCQLTVKDTDQSEQPEEPELPEQPEQPDTTVSDSTVSEQPEEPELPEQPEQPDTTVSDSTVSEPTIPDSTPDDSTRFDSTRFARIARIGFPKR